MSPLAPLKVAIAGCSGRMGKRLLALAGADPNLQYVGGVRSSAGKNSDSQSTNWQQSANAANVTNVYASLDELIDKSGHKPAVVVDFSKPDGTMALVPACVRHGVSLVIGTTGFTSQQLEEIDAAAKKIPLCIAANFSLGVNLLVRLVGEVASSLGEDFDIELVEAHHNRKVDAPSGTAVALLDSIAKATGRTTCNGHADSAGASGENPGDKMVLVHGREGRDAKRRRGEVGVHALRMGNVVGEHSVMYASDFERITLSHHAETRDVFASGALRMAKWIAGRPSGKYEVSDMLFESVSKK
ncbi:dihydrodipicolinate reductase [Besnoitia besnoiti]|uniref:4-hydroxy-tetrahydrodipicolinate reductase n=1 Tax=Besnoitia besnoiti TaxID=94643 RepID=A0A2A9M4F7_BESBE|nr:dihydrodipicolinate reductase [Besnoitia besnoiti]PFH32829.1 dihydrodipicolinate reductase [Besnoitia besnoiti]